MAKQFDLALIQHLVNQPPDSLTKQQEAYLNDYCVAAGMTSETTGTGASKSSLVSSRASSINLSALSSNARFALERRMEGVEDRWNRSSTAPSKAKTPSSYSVASTPIPASSGRSTVVQSRPNAAGPSEAGSRTTVKASREPPELTAGMSLDEIARLGTGTPKETDRQFRELIDEMVAAQKTLSENDTKQRYFFFNQQKKKTDSGSN
ncbi:hypothetical protein CEP54_014807 [Fusarium duplospermum]|uniref:Uncharacterized protein n=1 Tax=Fusarium duplospermum TaxID=1325734 RepID=A0A428NTM9_9HYPO|nr:hypothetical protein CEP54_014807 [Fusarium duplospermum]